MEPVRGDNASDHSQEVGLEHSPGELSLREEEHYAGTPLPAGRLDTEDSLAYPHYQEDDFSEYDLETGSIAGRSAAGHSHVSRAESRLDKDLRDAIDMVRVSDRKIGALRKMHAQYLLKRVEDALTGDDQRASQRLLGDDREDRSEYTSDEESSLADSAFTGRQHKRSSSHLDFERQSARYEKSLGLDTESLMGRSRGPPSEASDDENPKVFTAEPYTQQDFENESIFGSEDGDGDGDGDGSDKKGVAVNKENFTKKFKRRYTYNKPGIAIMTYFLCSFIFYMYVRIVYTLDLGKYKAYGIYVLAVEVMGASATFLYGINLLLNPVPPEEYHNLPDKPEKADKQRRRRWWRRKGKASKDEEEQEHDAENPKLEVEHSAGSTISTVSGLSKASRMTGTTAMSGRTAITVPGGLPSPKEEYHVRVLVPCYKESLEIVQKTVNALLAAALPGGCKRTVYVLDDGKDKKKRKWVGSMARSDVVYVSGRKRPADESNGKSGNLNNACKQIYPGERQIPKTEIICVMDADQEADPWFFTKMLPLLDDGDDIAMVLSPQCFHNLHADCDIFNHSNIHFWEYMQIGYDAWSFISCSGTNFLIRANAFQECGWSPEWTLTEDFALGMELKKRGWQCRYQREYLAIGDAPSEVRNCFQQKSRWCKGHFQVLFHKDHCPIFQHDLSWFQRLMYLQGVWSYIVASFCTPTFIAVPIVTIWGGVFPIVLNFWAAVGLTAYYIGASMVLNYMRSPKHYRPLWFSNVANQIMWWTYIKAFWRGLNSALGNKISFKTTLKGTGRLGKSIGDLWLPTVVLLALVASLIQGLRKLTTATTVQNTLFISVVWVIWNLIPPALLLYYNFFGNEGKSTILKWLCRLGMALSTVLTIVALVLIWLFYPPTYNFGQALGDSHFFFEAQRVGRLPDRDVSWRGDSLLQEYAINFNQRTFDFGGGFVSGGQVGTSKVTMPIAWTTGMVAWGMLDFEEGYKEAGQYNKGLRFLAWSTQYLLKTIVGSAAKPLDIKVIWQVGNLTEDNLVWSRPEDITAARPFYYVPVQLGASDLLGQMVGALASTATVFKTVQPAYYDQLMSWALPLYGVATGQYQGLYLDYLKKPACVLPPSRRQTVVPNCNPPYFPLNGSAADLYNSTTYYDDIAWAAMWMYRATQDDGYLDDAKQFFGGYQSSDESKEAESLIVDWNNNYWSSAILLASQTDLDAYHYQAQDYLQKWICSSDKITYTRKGRAWDADKGSMDVTANTAMMAAVYGKSIQQSIKKDYQVKSKRYICWAKGQLRFMLGDVVEAAMVGFQQPASQTGWIRLGMNGPKQPHDRAASCPSPPTPCNFINALYNPDSNPHTLRGALVEGSSTGFDEWPDVRTRNESRVALEYNAGFTSALAGVHELSEPTWPQCLQGYGYFSKDPVCG